MACCDSAYDVNSNMQGKKSWFQHAEMRITHSYSYSEKRIRYEFLYRGIVMERFFVSIDSDKVQSPYDRNFILVTI